jgi:hypothetical protein
VFGADFQKQMKRSYITHSETERPGRRKGSPG